MEFHNRNVATKDSFIGMVELPLDHTRQGTHSVVKQLQDKHGAHAGQVELEIQLDGSHVRHDISRSSQAELQDTSSRLLHKQ